jgi:hypothetical protein
MISPEARKLLEELGKTNFGQALREFLDDELKSIDTVDGVTTLDEALGRDKAVKLIRKIFSFLDKDKKVDKPRTSYR